MGKFTKALQKSKKEKKPVATKSVSTGPITKQASKQTDRTVLKKKKLMAEQLKRKAMIQKKIMTEQARKSAALSKKIEKPESKKVDKVSDEFDLGSIHSALKDSQKKQTPAPGRKDKYGHSSQLFEAPGMDLSADKEKKNVSEEIIPDSDETKMAGESAKPGLKDIELSAIHEMFDVQTGPDDSEASEDTILEDLEAILDDSVPDTAKEEQKDLLPQKDVPGGSNVIPIDHKKAVDSEEKTAVIPEQETITKRYEPPEIGLADFKSSQIDPGLISLLRPESFEAEQFRMLRSNILFPLQGKPPRTILVTSSIPGEGKTFVSTNLAITFALDMQSHVLLVDCDIRKPSVHRRFGYHNIAGLSEYLSGKMDVASILLNTNVTKLKILPGGKPPKNPSELLSSKRMSDLLDEVKNKFPDRYIIIDSPPPKLTAETNVLSRRADGIIIVAKYGKTRREDIDELVDKFGKEKILGVIINWFNLRASRYYGYGKYGSYKYFYGKQDK